MTEFLVLQTAATEASIREGLLAELGAAAATPVFWIQLGAIVLATVIVYTLSSRLLAAWVGAAGDDAEQAGVRNRAANVLRRVTLIALIVGAALIAIQVSGIAADTALHTAGALLLTWLATSGVRIAVIVVVAHVALDLLRALVHRIKLPPELSGQARAETRAKTIRALLDGTLKVLVWTVVFFVILGELGVNIAPLLAGAGIAGLAIGFGAQSLVKDVITGFFVLAEDQYGVGDVVRIGDLAGLVERVTLRTTILRDLEGRVHVIPNGEITKVTVFTKEWSRALIDVEVAYKENLDFVIQTIREVGERIAREHADLVTAGPDILGVESLGSHGVTVRLLFQTKPITQWTVMRAFRKAIKDEFDRRGIEIPFPQTSVWMRGGPGDQIALEPPEAGE
jgi:moderate conductance mechanosensitive channel